MSLVFKTPISTLNTTTRSGQNIGSGECPPCPECPECPEVDLTTGTAEYTANGDYTLTPEGDGFSSVEITVSVPSDVNNQNKTVSPSTSSQTVSADSGYSGLGTVTVDAVTSSIDNNISAGNIKKDVTILGVTGNYDPQPNLINITVTPSTNSQEYNPAISGVDGYSLVSVSAVTAAIDNNITAGNIKKDVAILGVTGTYDPQPTLQDKTVTPTTSQQVISADNGYDGLDEVTVSAVTSAIDQNIVAGNIKSGVSILGVQGTVQEGITPTGNINITNTSSTDVTNYATAQVVDANLVAGNIKNGVSILGVNGSYDPQPNLEIVNFNANTVGEYSVAADPQYDGMSAVGVNVSSAPLGSAGNPFDDTDDIDSMNFSTDGYFSFYVYSGSIDSTTGRYVAVDANGNTVKIDPYLENPNFDENSDPDPVDNPEYIFPNDFDLTDKTIVVHFYKRDFSWNNNREMRSDPVQTYTIAESTLWSINGNGNSDTWLIGSVSLSTRSVDIGTYNGTANIALTAAEPWEITINTSEPEMSVATRSATKSGLKSPAPQTLFISPMRGDAGSYVLNVSSELDGEKSFTIEGTNSGATETVTVNSLGNYFTIESLEDGNEVSWKSWMGIDLWFSTDDGETWERTDTAAHTWYLDEGETVMFKNDVDRYNTNATDNQSYFSSTKTVNIYGDIRSLICSTDYPNAIYKAPLVFSKIFKSLKVVVAEDLLLPETVSPECYYGMFADCSTLTIPPALPATSLVERCYGYMFANCTSLEEAPELPATVLAMQCYTQMFQGCTGLVTPPELPAIYLATGCYSNMFSGCSSLETAPELPATTLQQTCYEGMFGGCTSLTTAPELPATKLANYCYRSMFKDCTALTETPILPASSLPTSCYWQMFMGCSNLDTVTCLATTMANNSTKNWLDGVAAEGTFYKDPNSSWTADSADGIPTGWTVENYGL